MNLVKTLAPPCRITATKCRTDKKPRIAIADDEPLDRELVRRALCLLSVEIHQAANGVELVELLRHLGPFDVVVTDVAMPRMSGIQALAAVRAAGIGTPFIVVSALSDACLVEKLAASGAASFIAKPLDLAHLRKVVTNFLTGTTAR